MSLAAKALLAFALSAASTLASAEVFQFDGRYYEVVLNDGISWAQANAAASIRPHPAGLDIQGGLATITSQDEENAIIAHMPAPQGVRTEVWLGGTKQNGVWRWNNGGLILNVDNLVPPFTREAPYTNWQLGQPDGSDNATTVAFGPGADNLFGLDDQKKTNAILGYVVAWGDRLNPVAGQDCLTGCNLPEGNVPKSIYKLPAGTNPMAQQIDVRAWVIPFQEGLSRCGLPDSDFDGEVDPGEGTPKPVDLDGDGQPEVIFPGYVCAHPEVGFVVLFKTTSNVTPNGAVEVENFSDVLLPTAYDCDSKIPRNVPPTHQAIGLWQDDVLARMPEGEFFEGTFACGSDRLKGGRGSYWAVGANINFGDADEYTGFLQLALYKLHWALEQLEQAIAADVLSTGDGTQMMNDLLTAIADLNKGNITECRKHVLNFNKHARTATYTYETSPPDINFKAQFEMRGDNLLFTLAKLTAAKQFVAQ